MANRWYTIQVQGALVNTAVFNLKRQHFEPFFPQIEVRQTKAISVLKPMFVGYGFVQFDIERDQWLSVNGTRGVIGLLPRHLQIPTPMREGFIEKLIENDPLRDETLIEVFEEYHPGITQVVVDAGHHFLGGSKGTVVAVRSKLLQVSFNWRDTNHVWLNKDQVSVIKEI